MMDVSARNVEIAALELKPLGLEFKSRSVETEYRTWHAEEGLPMTRLGMQVSIFNWVAATAAFSLVGGTHQLWFGLWVLAIQIPLNALTLVLTYRSTHRVWLAPLTAVGNAMAGLTCIAACFWSLDRPEVSTIAVMIVAQFAFTIFPLHFQAAFASVLLFVGFHEVLVIRSFAAGAITWSSTLFYSLGAIVALVSGGLASMLIERSSRKRFQQSRVIEIQRKTIERERARADVAERSRELSEALTKLTEKGPVARLVPGDIIEAKFKVISALGRGGMGEVHEVEQLSDGKHLAMKVLTGNIDREALLRFAREAKIAASIDHPNVVEVVEVGVAPAGMYLVMELVTGKSLEGSRSRFGDLAWALPVLRQIAEALASMHARGIVHRDLKPGNILLDGSTPKVTDFGISSLADAPAGPVDAEGATQMTMGDPALTRTGAILGTPLYMAPELTGGSREAKPSADLWAFGVIAYEMLTGSHPFAEAPVLARLGGRPVPAAKPLSSKLERPLTALIERCLASDPTQRPSAAELRDALAGV